MEGEEMKRTSGGEKTMTRIPPIKGSEQGIGE